jgi:hypothetical protein
MTESSEFNEELSCDLCILGAGIAGLNALFAASRYLSRNQKVVLVDRNAGPGGMWRATYDYVRLHQPHGTFTAGNVAWTSGREPGYLAARSEVAAHLGHCLETLQARLNIELRYGYQYLSHDESGAAPDEVLVRCDSTLRSHAEEPRASTSGRGALRIKTKKLVKAFGINVQANDALSLSSTEVRSVSPDHQDLLGAEMRASDAPVYVVGGGKTGMDTAYSLITRFPNKRISILIGQGTMFFCRDKMFPSGLRRYWSGAAPLEQFLDLAQRFDGHNERQVLEYLRSRYCVSLVSDARRFMLGILSEHENAVIAARAHELLKDYLVDVVDREAGPTMLLKSGATRPIEPGSWVVNCTGYLLRDRTPYEPFVSESGKVISIQPSSSIHALSSSAAYLTVHLSYLDQLQRLPLYELDFGGLYAADRDAMAIAIAPHTLYNMGLIFGAVPRSVIDEFGTDSGRWYPLPRRLLGGLQFARYQRANPGKLRRTLDVVRERFHVRCGPLAHAAQA